MELTIIERLFTSFSELEAAISKARDTLHQRAEVPTGVLGRLDSYDAILARQRTLAVALCGAITAKDWEEVNRNVSLINGLSKLIREDAQSILKAIATNSLGAEENDEGTYC